MSATPAFCPSCGVRRWPGATFCGACGLDLNAWERDVAEEVAAVTPTDRTPALERMAPDELESVPFEDLDTAHEAQPGWNASDSPAGLVDTWAPDGTMQGDQAYPSSAARSARSTRRGRPPAIGIAVVVLAALATVGGLAAVLILGGSIPGFGPVASTLTAQSTDRASVEPSLSQSTPPTPGPTPPPTDAPRIWSPTDIEALMRDVPPALVGSCTILQPAATGDPERSTDALAALDCQPSGATRRVVYELLPDVATAQSLYDVRVAQQGVGRDSGGCWNGTIGEVDYSYGRAACWIDSAAGATRVTWTDQRASVVASATARSGGLQDLVDWWWNAATLTPDSGGAALTVDQQFLLAQLPGPLQSTCTAYDATKDPGGVDPVGDVGAIDCYPRDKLIQDVGWFRFTTKAALDAWYSRRIVQVGLQANSGGCFDGAPGETTWAAGRIACYQRSTSQNAAIRWTDDNIVTYGALNATNTDLPALVGWWQSNRLP